MGFTGITLVLVSLAFLGSAAAHDCQNGTRPESQNDREGCDFYCWNGIEPTFYGTETFYFSTEPVRLRNASYQTK
uniref:Putative tick salivary peptide group 1 n=1 Tax=Ixodes ricinus TaxID=34613 RepID=V5H9N7_IXORI